jgi:hypothetical protein
MAVDRLRQFAIERIGHAEPPCVSGLGREQHERNEAGSKTPHSNSQILTELDVTGQHGRPPINFGRGIVFLSEEDP